MATPHSLVCYYLDRLRNVWRSLYLCPQLLVSIPGNTYDQGPPAPGVLSEVSNRAAYRVNTLAAGMSKMDCVCIGEAWSSGHNRWWVLCWWRALLLLGVQPLVEESVVFD